MGVAKNWSWEGILRPTGLKLRLNVESGNRVPASQSAVSSSSRVRAKPQMQTHVWHEKAVKMLVAGINFVSFTAQIYINN